MNIIISELQCHDDQLYQLISSATQSYLLSRALSEKDEKDYELSLPFILYHENLYIKNMALDLYKILHDNNNERYNIHKYIRRIESEKKHFKKLDTNHIELWKNKLLLHEDLILNIKNLRSKYYAHLDKDHVTYLLKADSEIEFVKLESLISDLQDFYIESNAILYNRPVGFESPITIEYFDKILSKHLKTE